MPVDAKLQDEADLPYEMAKVDDIIADLSRAKNIRIVILDACRDNPMAERLRVSLPASRSAAVSRGLARIERTQGLITAFATQPGQVAADGFGKRNSPFTTAILKHIATAGIEAGTLFRRVAQDVNESTGGKQLPELSVSLLGEFYFAGQGAGSPTGAAQPPADQAAQAWATTQNTTSVAVLEDFVRQFGSTVYGSMARARLEELRRAQVGGVAAFLPQPAPNQQAAVAPPAQPAPAPTPFHFDFTPPSSNQQAAVTPSAQPVPGPSPTLASSGQLATATPLECSAYITNIHRDWDSSVVRAACAAEAPASGPYMVSFSDPLKEKYYSCHSYLKALSGSERITNCTDFI
jgi:hypothetical protein